MSPNMTVLGKKTQEQDDNRNRVRKHGINRFLAQACGKGNFMDESNQAGGLV
jgi:hypothetical protein